MKQFQLSVVLAVVLLTLTRFSEQGHQDPNLFCEAEPSELPRCTEKISMPDAPAMTTTTVSPTTNRTEPPDTCPSCLHICEEERSRCDMSEPRMIARTVFESPLIIQPDATTTEKATASKPELEKHGKDYDDGRSGPWKPRVFFDVFTQPDVAKHHEQSHRHGPLPDSPSQQLVNDIHNQHEQQHLSHTQSSHEQQQQQLNKILGNEEQKQMPAIIAVFEQEDFRVVHEGPSIHKQKEPQQFSEIQDELEKQNGVHGRSEQQQFPGTDDEFEKQHFPRIHDEFEKQLVPRVFENSEQQYQTDLHMAEEQLETVRAKNINEENERRGIDQEAASARSFHENNLMQLQRLKTAHHLEAERLRGLHGNLGQEQLKLIQERQEAERIAGIQRNHAKNYPAHQHHATGRLQEFEGPEQPGHFQMLPDRLRYDGQGNHAQQHHDQRQLQEGLDQQHEKMAQERQEAERTAGIQGDQAEHYTNMVPEQQQLGISQEFEDSEQLANFQVFPDRIRYNEQGSHIHQEHGQQRYEHPQQLRQHEQQEYAHQQQHIPQHNARQRYGQDQIRQQEHAPPQYGQRQYAHQQEIEPEHSHHSHTQLNPNHQLPLPHRDNSFRRRKRPNFYYKFM